MYMYMYTYMCMYMYMYIIRSYTCNTCTCSCHCVHMILTFMIRLFSMILTPPPTCTCIAMYIKFGRIPLSSIPPAPMQLCMTIIQLPQYIIYLLLHQSIIPLPVSL